jgi:ribonuclease BN (tRNA processing enzyme)
LIQLVWISHLHADHHLGLIHLIVQRKLHLPVDVFRPLFIIAPMFVLRFLEEVAVMMPEIADAFVGIPSNCFDPTDLLCTECVTEDGVIAQLQRNTIDSTIEASGSSSSDPEEEEVHAAPSSTTNASSNEEALPVKRRKLKDYRYRPRIIASELDTATSSGSTAAAAAAASAAPAHVKSSTSPLLAPTAPTPTSAKILMTMVSSAFKECKQLFESLGIVELINVPVIHCIQANGLVLTIRKTTSRGMPSSATTEHNPGEGVEVEDPSLLKIVYSGDTRPSEMLILWGQDAHILLHEATFEDDKCMEAVQKKHSTINEAVEVARLMRTPHLILTHFSQRYHGIPMQFHPQYPLLLQQQQLMEAKATAVEQGTSAADVSVATPVLQTTPVTATTDVVVAFDFMTVSDRELTWAKGLTPLLAEIFPALPVPGEEEDEDLLGKEEAAAAAAATGRNQG